MTVVHLFLADTEVFKRACGTTAKARASLDPQQTTCKRCRATKAWKTAGGKPKPRKRARAVKPRPQLDASDFIALGHAALKPARKWDPSLEVQLATTLFVFGDPFSTTPSGRWRKAVEDARELLRLVYEGGDELPPLSSLSVPGGVPPDL